MFFILDPFKFILVVLLNPILHLLKLVTLNEESDKSEYYKETLLKSHEATSAFLKLV